jgi:hypothetical protein
MRADLIVKFFQNPSIPWLPTGLPKVEIWQFFVFFRNLENLGYLKRKKSFVDGYAPPNFPNHLPFFFLFLANFRTVATKQFRKFLFKSLN